MVVNCDLIFFPNPIQSFLMLNFFNISLLEQFYCVRRIDQNLFLNNLKNKTINTVVNYMHVH